MIGLHCTKCGGETSVINSRPDRLDQIGTITRRRRCDDCGHRYWTHELPEDVLARLETRLAEFETLKSTLRGVMNKPERQAHG